MAKKNDDYGSWESLRDEVMSPERIAAANARTAQMAKEMPLAELRHARKLSQKTLADALGTGQAAVSRLERRTDMYLSTLRGIIEAMGGHLEIVARFPDGDVKIARFAKRVTALSAAKAPPAGKVIHMLDALKGPFDAATARPVTPRPKAAYKRPSGAKKRGVVKASDVARLKHRGAER